MKDEFTKIEKHEFNILPCPLCDSQTELWQRQETEDGPASKVVCCSNSDPVEPFEECVFYLPSEGFYRARKSEAVNVWNEFVEKLKLNLES